MRLGKGVFACLLACMSFLFIPLQVSATELTEEEVAEFRALLEERKAAKEERALTADEVSSIRGFLDQFKDIKFGGFVESYYQYESVNPKPNTGNSTDNAIPPKVFDNVEDGFTVNNIELWMYKEAPNPGDIGFKFTLNWGEMARAITFVGPSDDTDEADNTTFSEAYALWNVPIGKGLTVKFGKFATWVGYEVWEAHWNPNFSRSYIYGWLIPFTNTGIGISYPFTDKFTADYYFVNTSDTFIETNHAKTHGLQLNYDVGDIGFVKGINLHLDTLWGPENDNNNKGSEEAWRHRYDFTVSFSPFEKFGMATNFNFSSQANLGGTGNHKTQKAWGIAQYFTYDLKDNMQLALRGEYIWDHDAMAGVLTINRNAQGVSMGEITATLNYRVREKLWIRPEIRYDKIIKASGPGSANLFKTDANAKGHHNKNITGTIAVTYEF